MLKNLLDISQQGLEDMFDALDLPRYKAKETFRQIHQGLKDSIGGITALKKEERGLISKDYEIVYPQIIREQKKGDTKKIALKLKDGLVVETVLMRYEDERNTVCVSSQVGCPVGCRFCATGKMGFKRNLTAGEILAQVYSFAKSNKISNVVFMGMGEPFLNYDNALESARTLNSKLGQNIAARKIVISTVGIISGIKKLANAPEQFRLAWSLAAPADDLRCELAGFSGLPSIDSAVKAIKEYQAKTKRRVTIEYVLLKGVNDSDQAAVDTAKIARQFDCNVNVIPYNLIAGARFAQGKTNEFLDKLIKMGINASVRRSFGSDICAACGQLAGRG